MYGKARQLLLAIISVFMLSACNSTDTGKTDVSTDSGDVAASPGKPQPPVSVGLLRSDDSTYSVKVSAGVPVDDLRVEVIRAAIGEPVHDFHTGKLAANETREAVLQDVDPATLSSYTVKVTVRIGDREFTRVANLADDVENGQQKLEEYPVSSEEVKEQPAEQEVIRD